MAVSLILVIGVLFTVSCLKSSSRVNASTILVNDILKLCFVGLMRCIIMILSGSNVNTSSISVGYVSSAISDTGSRSSCSKARQHLLWNITTCADN